MEHVALFVVGLLLLGAGAGCLVVGAARLDRATGRSAFAVGIVAVGFGPCVAGLAFDLATVLRAPPRMTTGHIVGSNIASVGLVLGLAALVRPTAGAARLHSTAISLLIAATLLFWFLARDNRIERGEAGVLLAAGAAALVLLIRAARLEPETVKAEFGSWVPERFPLWLAVGLGVLGAAAMVGGALLTGAKALEATRALRTSTFVMGGTVAALGTALPAVFGAVLAARRDRSDLVLGLAAGPALFNLFLVVGVVALAEPLQITEHAITNEVPVMALFSLLLVPVLANGFRVPRWEGALLLVAYAGFVAWQVVKK